MSDEPAVLPTRIVLPADAVVPGTTTVAPGGTAPPTDTTALDDDHLAREWQEPWVAPTVELRDDGDRAAWFHFCLGHQVEFLNWEATTATCRRAAVALAGGDDDALTAAVTTLADLVEGSGAMLSYCGAFDPERYDPLLRASMAAVRDDFSGDMSPDFLAMAAAKRDLRAALDAAAGDPAVGPAASAAARDRLAAAERYWYHHHGEVVMALHPGDSLLKVKVDQLTRRSADFDYERYVDQVVHGDEARRDYDGYFGVSRVAHLPVEAYWTQALEKLAAVHRHFRLDPDVRRRLLRGDAALLSVISAPLT